MTIERFEYLVANGSKGKLITATHENPPFCLEEVLNEIFAFEDVQICYQDKHFLWMKDKEGNSIKKEDCTIFDIQQMDSFQLALLVKDAQKVLKQRQIEEAEQAVEQFTKAWNNLKRFGEVRVRVSATGQTHYHTTVEKLNLEFLPIT